MRIDNLVSTTLKMWPETFLDSSPSGACSNLPCHFNQFFDIFQGFIELSFHTKTKRSAELQNSVHHVGSPHLLFPRLKPCYKLRIYTVIENCRGGSRKFRRGDRETCQRFRPSYYTENRPYYSYEWKRGWRWPWVWTPGLWTTSVDLVHGPPRGPGPWTTPVDHP